MNTKQTKDLLRRKSEALEALKHSGPIVDLGAVCTSLGRVYERENIVKFLRNKDGLAWAAIADEIEKLPI